MLLFELKETVHQGKRRQSSFRVAPIRKIFHSWDTFHLLLLFSNLISYLHLHNDIYTYQSSEPEADEFEFEEEEEEEEQRILTGPAVDHNNLVEGDKSDEGDGDDEM